MLLDGRLENLAPRVPLFGIGQHLEGDQRMLEFADRVLATGVLVVEPVEHAVDLCVEFTQLREQQLRFLRVVQLLGKFVDVEEHGAKGIEVRQPAAPAVLAEQQGDGPKHRRQCAVLLANDAAAGVCHRAFSWRWPSPKRPPFPGRWA